MTTSKASPANGSVSSVVTCTSTRTPAAAPALRACAALPSLVTANAAWPLNPTFAAIAPASDRSVIPSCSARSPIRTPLIATGNRSRLDLRRKNIDFPHDIVADRDCTTANCPCTRQAWRDARGPRRGQHDDNRRRVRDSQGPRPADRLVDADGHDPAWQAHGSPRAAYQ